MTDKQRAFEAPRLLLIVAIELACCVSMANAAYAEANAKIIPLGLPKQDGFPNQKLAEFGKQLFFDTRLSADRAVSCATCHQPNRAFSDGKAHATGTASRSGTRNTPSLYNVSYLNSLFWDGRTTSLESQVKAPLLNAVEHGLVDEDAVLDIIRHDQKYVAQIKDDFQTSSKEATLDQIEKAIAAYERTLVAANSSFDRYQFGKEKDALSTAAIRGLNLFRGRANCSSCHVIDEHEALFTDQRFNISPLPLPPNTTERLGLLVQKIVTSTGSNPDHINQLIATDSDIAALGRFVVTLNPSDIGKFKTPSLRNVALTAPYMHDGSVGSLEQAIELELYGRGNGVNYPIVLTAQEKQDLLEFLKSLSSPVIPTATP